MGNKAAKTSPGLDERLWKEKVGKAVRQEWLMTTEMWEVIIFFLNIEEWELAVPEHLSIAYLRSLPTCSLPTRTHHGLLVLSSLWPCPYTIYHTTYHNRKTICDHHVGNSPSSVPLYLLSSRLFPMSLWYLLPSNTGNWFAYCLQTPLTTRRWAVWELGTPRPRLVPSSW